MTIPIEKILSGNPDALRALVKCRCPITDLDCLSCDSPEQCDLESRLGLIRDARAKSRLRVRATIYAAVVLAGMALAVTTCSVAVAQVVNHDHPSQYSGKGEPAPAVRPRPRPCITGPAWWRRDVVPCATATQRGSAERPDAPEKREARSCDRCKDVVRDYWQDRDVPKSSKPGGPVGGDGKGRERARERRERVEECL